METYDVIVVGGGPGGYVAAIRAAQSKLKTALVEKDELGGVCLNWGCIPTKSLLRSAEAMRLLSKGDDLGFSVGDAKPVYARAQARSREASARLVKGVGYLMQKNGVTVYRDEARCLDARTVELVSGKQKLGAKNLILATGARPAVPAVLAAAGDRLLDSKSALQLTGAPKRLVIVGAGAIGVEFATVFAAFGTEVTVVELLPRLLPEGDDTASEVLLRAFKRQRIQVLTGATITGAERDKTGVTVTAQRDGVVTRLPCDHVLAATGVRPNSDCIGPLAGQLAQDARGFVTVDDAMRTGLEGVYAIGDLTGKLPLAHTASAQALVAVDAILGKATSPIHYANVPRCVYTSPESASAGLTEAQAKARGHDAATASFPFTANGKAVTYGETDGAARLVYDKKYGELLGVHLVGPHVTEMIGGAAGFLQMEMTVEELAAVIFPHPTASEAIIEAAHLAEGFPVHI